MSKITHSYTKSGGWDHIEIGCSCGEIFREYVDSQKLTREDEHAAEMRAHSRWLRHLEEMLLRERYETVE